MRLIWTVTGIIVGLALVILTVREYRKMAHARVQAEAIQAREDAAYESNLKEMFARLEYDHQAWHVETQRVVEAVAALAESKTRETAETYYALALRLHGERRLDEAEAAYHRAAELDPTWSWPYTGLGILLYERGRHDEARWAFRKAMELDPTSSRPHNDLSIVLRLDHRLEEAEKEAEAAYHLGPNRLDTLNTYANVLKELGKNEQAEAMYRRAIEIDPNHPTPQYNLACLLTLRGETDLALQYLARALDLNPSFEDFAVSDPDLQALRSDPRFKELVQDESKDPT